MIGRKPPPKEFEKQMETINDKNYKWCKGYKAQVEPNPEGKEANVYQLWKKLEGKRNPGSQGQTAPVTYTR